MTFSLNLIADVEHIAGDIADLEPRIADVIGRAIADLRALGVPVGGEAVLPSGTAVSSDALAARPGATPAPAGVTDHDTVTTGNALQPARDAVPARAAPAVSAAEGAPPAETVSSGSPV